MSYKQVIKLEIRITHELICTSLITYTVPCSRGAEVDARGTEDEALRIFMSSTARRRRVSANFFRTWKEKLSAR